MDKQDLDIKALKDIIEKSLTFKKSSFYLAALILTGVSASISTISTTYLSERVSSYVVKSEFDETLNRIEATVKTTEAIQQEIRTKYLDQIEARKILRSKFEEIYIETIEFRTYLDKIEKLAIHGQHPSVDDKSLSRIEMLQALYFPKLEQDFVRLFNSHSDYKLYLYSFQNEINGKPKHEPTSDELVKKQTIIIEKIEDFRANLVKEYSYELNL
ncbi:hypothetical protein AB6E22_22415 [Vibrio cyclitrophicus]|uniref:hypothetical protein n=1 Tax=Vibrio cyclitrophicus TaxID=47951 RepID=UPI00030CF2C2|nr:hypothetical protein [Vibrio cyclitrophicus]OEF76435.1 hypothetical protein OA5_04850 [Vibrio cyclitrophicus 1F111]